MNVTIIICCYNSAGRIARTLASLASQRLPAGVAGEILLVDNNSQDGTGKVAAEFWAASGSSRLTLQVLPEARQGLTHARLRGIHSARHEMCMFVDDDVVLAEDFLSVAVELVDAHPEVAVFGGWVDPLFEDGVIEPAWFREIDGVFTVGNKGSVAHYCASAAGAAMVFRRSAVTALLGSGFQFALADRTGAALSGGGDVEMCLALQLQGWRVYYDPRLRLKHLVTQRRLNWDYAGQVARGMGQSEIFLQPYRMILGARDGVSARRLALKHSWPVQVVVRLMQSVLYGFRAVAWRLRGKPICNARVVATIHFSMVRTLIQNWSQYRAIYARARSVAPHRSS